MTWNGEQAEQILLNSHRCRTGDMLTTPCLALTRLYRLDLKRHLRIHKSAYTENCCSLIQSLFYHVLLSSNHRYVDVLQCSLSVLLYCIPYNCIFELSYAAGMFFLVLTFHVLSPWCSFDDNIFQFV